MDNNQLKAIIIVSISFIIFVSIIAISTNYDTKLKADVMIECLKAQKFDCTSK
jgi:hypothetical protein